MSTPTGKSKAGVIRKPLTAPKGGPSGYMLFAHENRDKVREETPELKFGEVGKLLSVKWYELTDKERESYQDKAMAVRWHSEYELLFAQRPRGFNEKSAWLRQLEKQYGQKWYSYFFRWYLNRLHHPKPEWCRDSINTIFRTIKWASPQASWHPTDSSLKRLTYYLSNAPVSTAPDLYVGRYNGHSIGVVFNGAALDLPQVGIQTLRSLAVRYAHLPMFAGLRMKESNPDLCLLILGKVYASTNNVPFDDDDWFDTRFVLALDAANGWRKKEFVLVYKYEVYSIDYLDDGSEKRSEEAEHGEPPEFCNGPDAFTVAVCETGTSLLSKSDIKDNPVESSEEPPRLPDIRLTVRSVKKPDLAVAGYVNDANPYVPVFPLGEN